MTRQGSRATGHCIFEGVVNLHVPVKAVIFVRHEASRQTQIEPQVGPRGVGFHGIWPSYVTAPEKSPSHSLLTHTGHASFPDKSYGKYMGSLYAKVWCAETPYSLPCSRAYSHYPVGPH